MSNLKESFLKFVASWLIDLSSFRNKLTVFICILMTLVIVQNKGNSSVILASLGVLDSYLIYYLYNRKKHDPK